ncbi:hypothetical protein GCM10029964_087340 [Kibdelosporangium lantanae]
MVVAWKPLEAKYRTAEESRPRGTSPSASFHRSAEWSCNQGTSARSRTVKRACLLAIRATVLFIGSEVSLDIGTVPNNYALSQ